MKNFATLFSLEPAVDVIRVGHLAKVFSWYLASIAQTGQGNVPSYDRKPRPDILIPEHFSVGPGAQKGLLRDVFRGRLVTEEPGHRTREPQKVPLVPRLEAEIVCSSVEPPALILASSMVGQLSPPSLSVWTSFAGLLPGRPDDGPLFDLPAENPSDRAPHATRKNPGSRLVLS